ncbi:MAG: cellulase family glycosylhydrolase, partial [Nitrososphaeria archaeon]
PFQPTYSWTVQDFVNFWVNVSLTLKNYPNVIYCLFDEPTAPSAYSIYDWFNAANQTIYAVREVGSNQLIVIHWGYCSSNVNWISWWINGGYLTENIVFSTHIYRYHGTFQGDSNSPVDISYIRNWLNRTSLPNVMGYKYVMDTYNVPIWVSAIGAHNGVTDDSEYVYFWNTLQVLNDWEMGYVLFDCGRTNIVWTGLQNPLGEVWSAPNRIGQALINAIKGIPPPPTYRLTIYSQPLSVSFILNQITRRTPYNATLFADTYIVKMPQNASSYVHNVLFGYTEVTSQGGLTPYIYTAGPFATSSSVTISSINFYAAKPGKVRVAIYDAINYTLPGWPDIPHPNNLIVESFEYSCDNGNKWYEIPMPETQLSPGIYFIAIKINTNGMLGFVEQPWTGQFISSDYSQPFPNPFGTVEGVAACKVAVYVPSTPMEVYNYTFTRWSDGLTTAERKIDLTNDVELIAIYEISS